MISLGSFTVANQSNTVSLSVSSSVDIVLPESLSGACDPAVVAVKAKEGDIWVYHSDSCLLQVSFQINGTPIKAEYTTPRWGRVLAGCEVWRRLGLQLEPRPMPTLSQSEPPSAVVQFLKQRGVAVDVTSIVGSQALARLKILRCTFNFRLWGAQDGNHGAAKRARGSRREQMVLRPRGGQELGYLDVERERKREMGLYIERHARPSDHEFSIYGPEGGSEARECDGTFTSDEDESTDEYSPLEENNASLGQRSGSKRSRPRRASRKSSVMDDISAMEKDVQTISTLTEAAAHLLLTGRRPAAASVVKKPESPAVLEMAPAVFSNYYAQDVSDRASLIPTICSALSVLRKAQSPSLRRKFAALKVSGEEDTGTTTATESQRINSISRALWKLTITGTKMKLPDIRKMDRRQQTLHGPKTHSEPMATLTATYTTPVPTSEVDLEFLPLELGWEQLSQSTATSAWSYSSSTQGTLAEMYATQRSSCGEYIPEGLGEDHCSAGLHHKTNEFFPFTGAPSSTPVEFYPDENVPQTSWVEKSPQRLGPNYVLLYDHSHPADVEEVHPGQTGREDVEHLPDWAWDNGERAGDGIGLELGEPEFFPELNPC